MEIHPELSQLTNVCGSGGAVHIRVLRIDNAVLEKDNRLEAEKQENDRKKKERKKRRKKF